MRFLIACVMSLALVAPCSAIERKPLKKLAGKLRASVCRSCR